MATDRSWLSKTKYICVLISILDLFEVKMLLITLVILVISRFFSSKTETKKVELEQLEQMISSKKSKYKKKGK